MGVVLLLGIGLEFILTGPQALGMYLLIRQGLICTYFRYYARDFDTLKKTFWILMCMASKKCRFAFHMSPSTHTDR
jgi:hypothetical protein